MIFHPANVSHVSPTTLSMNETAFIKWEIKFQWNSHGWPIDWVHPTFKMAGRFCECPFFHPVGPISGDLHFIAFLGVHTSWMTHTLGLFCKFQKQGRLSLMLLTAVRLFFLSEVLFYFYINQSGNIWIISFNNKISNCTNLRCLAFSFLHFS